MAFDGSFADMGSMRRRACFQLRHGRQFSGRIYGKWKIRGPPDPVFNAKKH
jgi:hypothetical protein